MAAGAGKSGRGEENPTGARARRWQAAATKVQSIARMSLAGQVAAAKRAKLKLPESKPGRRDPSKAPAAGQTTGELSKLSPALALQDYGGRAHYTPVDDGTPVAGSRP